MRFAVVACSACRQLWAVETRHAKVSCANCSTISDLADRTRLWQGDDSRAAAVAAGRLRAGLTPVPAEHPRPKTRHDSPGDAAAAQAKGIVNRSDRAEAVALWMTRLVGQPPHDDLVGALLKAGLDRPRAEREIMRMLAMDYLMEPRAGSYRVLSA